MSRALAGLLGAAVFMAAVTPVAASDLGAEAAAGTIRACLEAADRDPVTERACAGLQALACIDADPAAQTTLGMAACFAAETEVWEAVIAGFEADILARADAWGDAPDGGADQAILVRRAQTAWHAFRRADCAQAAAIWGEGSMRSVATAECALGHSADRAIVLLSRVRAFEAP